LFNHEIELDGTKSLSLKEYFTEEEKRNSVGKFLVDFNVAGCANVGTKATGDTQWRIMGVFNNNL